MNRLRLYFKLISISLRSQMQYKGSFFMLLAAHFIATFVDIFGIWILFDRFKMVKGWSFEELALIYGVMHMGFAVAEAVARGFDSFGLLVKSGDFDRILLRPMGTLLQIATRELQLMRLGRFFQGLIILLWACGRLNVCAISVDAVVIFFSFVGTAFLFYGLFILQATMCFWTTETLEVMNIATYGGLQAGQYPMSIYNKYFRVFFSFVIPIGCVAFYPVATLLQREMIPFYLGGILAPLSGIVFFAFSCFVWRFGVRHYHSTGS